MIKDIIWDFDGTLFDTYPAMINSFKLALKDNGIEADDEEIIKYMKTSMSDAINHYSELYTLKKNFKETFANYDKGESFEKIEPFPYAKEICEYIASSERRNYILTHRGYSTIKLLKRFHMEDLFTEIVTKRSGFKRKPDPEGYLYLAEKYNMDKETTMIVGDREIEIQAARQAGLKVCLYNTNNVIYKEQPDFKVDSLKDLYSII